MSEFLTAAILAGLVLAAGLISIELGISAAIIEIILGFTAANFLKIAPPAWLVFLASLGGILLTFLAGSEVNLKLMKERLKESLLIGGLSFLLPFAACLAYAYYFAHWSLPAAKIAGVALSTTSLAVVYAVLVESGLTDTQLGKIIMAATFVTDFGTALFLSLLFLKVSGWTWVFLGFSVLMLVFAPKLIAAFFRRYQDRVIEPEIKLLFFLFLLAMFLGEMGKSHAILPIFVLGLLLSDFFALNRGGVKKLRTVAFALITPCFFLKGGMNIQFQALLANWQLILVFLLLKLGTKFLGVYPIAKMSLPNSRPFPAGSRMFLTLLMSTGLTFGTISSLYGLQAGYIDQAQFSVLVTVVILSAVVPTIIAQKFYAPAPENLKEEISQSGEEG